MQMGVAAGCSGSDRVLFIASKMGVAPAAAVTGGRQKITLTIWAVVPTMTA